MRGMNSDCIDMIYLDPPFNSKVIFRELPGKRDILSSFTDAWKLTDEDIEWHESIRDEHRCIYEVIKASEYSYGKNMKAYICVMTERLMEMHRILKPTGSIYLHCDPTASHYLKIIMDCVFGHTNFRNEIVWNKGYRGTPKKNLYQREHDTVLFYTKSDRFTWNKVTAEYRDKELKRYNKTDKDGRRYALVKRKRADGAVYYGKTYPEGKLQGDVISHIPTLSSTAKERTGYKTQKPLPLVDVFMRASSNEGDVVMDPFCGCATAPVSAEKLGRRWVGIDVSYVSGYLIKKRLIEEVYVGSPLIKEYEPVFRTDIPVRTDIKDKATLDLLDIKQKKYREQEGRCAGCGYPLPIRYLTKDRIVPGKRGGQYTDENTQLLCHPCNSTKGDRTMAWLRNKLKENDLIYHEDE